MSATVIESKLGFSRVVFAGILAGLAGGVVFGMLMAMMGMLPMIGAMIGQPNAFAGALVHLVISAGIGASYGTALLVLRRFPLSRGFAVISGMMNGAFWWVAGALVLMPLMLGMSADVLKVGTTQWFSLMGHLIYGVVTGLVLVPLSRRL
ncbi:MAG TPA: hypothetical protein VF813_09215 [Anaerolineaceae bacterium]